MKTIIESKRGCGYRKKGGIYFFGSGIGFNCCSLPIKLDICPCCGNGIKFTRGFQWVQRELLGSIACIKSDLMCPVSSWQAEQKLGLMWVGERHYKTPSDFMEEGSRLGISKRIATVPREFKIGETWIALAHKKCIRNEDGTYSPGIFQMFKPQEIQYVCDGEESSDELDSLEKRGITPVIVDYNN